MKNAVIIVAGGSGKRMGENIPKQFIEIKGKPVILHTLEKFLNFDAGIKIIVVVNPDFMELWKKLIKKFKIPELTSVAGGETRFHSVKKGLSELKDNYLTGIHDSVRPLISAETIRNIYMSASIHGNAVPAVPVKETVRQVKNSSSIVIDRSRLKIIQTPQVFHSDILHEAYKTEFLPEFTDDASVVEKYGQKIHLVDGDPYNIKITTPSDLEIVRALL